MSKPKYNTIRELQIENDKLTSQIEALILSLTNNNQITNNQTHNVEKLQKAIDERGLKARVQRVSVYHKDELDSSCKIIKKIKNINFEGKILDNCE